MRNNVKATGIYAGIGLAVLACLIWSGNFIVARGVFNDIPPIGLAFFRWLTASIVLFPFAIKKFREERVIIFKNKWYLVFTALAGVTLFNTCIYKAAHYSPAINLALIGTTSSPVFSIILAAIFLREKISLLRICGLLLCIAGILFLLGKGSWAILSTFHFSPGDGWIFAGAFFFAVYNIFARRRPAGLSPINFLFTIFSTGTILLLPFYFWEQGQYPAVSWTTNLILVILFLGIGASAISYLCWNVAIVRLGAGRTALFGNLIPIFSSLEALWLLHEHITWVHVVSGIMVITGLVIANFRSSIKKP